MAVVVMISSKVIILTEYNLYLFNQFQHDTFGITELKDMYAKTKKSTYP